MIAGCKPETRSRRTAQAARAAALVMLVILVLAVLCRPGVAGAEEGVEERARQAEELNRSARSAFVLGKLGEAAVLYEEAYKIDPKPKYLYNLGVCRLKLGTPEDLRAAEVNFTACLKLEPSGSLHDAARQQLVRVRLALDRIARDRQAAAGARPPARAGSGPGEPGRPAGKVGRLAALPPAAPPAGPPPSTPVYRKWWFWTIVGAVVVGGTLGGVLGAVAGQDTRVPEGNRIDFSSMNLGGRQP